MLLRTPNARDGEPRGTQPPEKRLEGGHQPHCKRGHEFTEENTYWVREGARACRACRAWQDKVQKARRKGEEPPPEPLLPTPCANDMGAAYTPETWDAWTARMKAEHNNGNGHGNSLNIEAQRIALDESRCVECGCPEHLHDEGGFCAGRCGGEMCTGRQFVARLLPTPTTEPDTGNGHARNLGKEAAPSRWGKYAAAIARWEAITRPAPEPTNLTDGYLKARAKRLARLDRRPVGMRGSLKVRRQLAAKFSEWMMGVPLGWITNVPGITRNEALKAAGNGVVPQQAAEALRFLLAMPTGQQVAEAHEPDDLLELLAVGE